MNTNNKEGKYLIISGFVILGGVLGGIYGFTANRFTLNEIFLLIAGGVVGGIALALICVGIIKSLKK